MLIKNNCFLFVLFFAASCGSKAPKENTIKELAQALEQSNSWIATTNNDWLAALEYKTQTPITKAKALLWFPKAKQVAELSNKQLHYLDSLKVLVNNAAAKEQPVNSLFAENNLGSNLYNRLFNYKKELLSIDGKIEAALSDSLVMISAEQDGIHNEEQFQRLYFAEINHKEAEALLSKLENNELIAANKCLQLCLDQVRYLGDDNYSFYQAICGQNARVLMAGDVLEITAGFGKFEKKNSAVMMINGTKVDFNDRNYGVYRLKTSKKRGKYSIPVKFSFIDQDGVEITRNMNVGYTIVDTIHH